MQKVFNSFEVTRESFQNIDQKESENILWELETF